jgi:hypothetical protein
MLATERLADIEARFNTTIKRFVILELDGETLRVILYLKDGTNLRVGEQWDGVVLKRYSYYWLTSANELKIGWDNAPHHTRVKTFPHHKHIGQQKNIEPSMETCLEDILKVIA